MLSKRFYFCDLQANLGSSAHGLAFKTKKSISESCKLSLAATPSVELHYSRQRLYSVPGCYLYPRYSIRSSLQAVTSFSAACMGICTRDLQTETTFCSWALPSFISSLGTGLKKRPVFCKWVLHFCPGLGKSCFPLGQSIKPHFFATHQSPIQVNCVTRCWSVQSREVMADPGMLWFGIKSKPF